MRHAANQRFDERLQGRCTGFGAVPPAAVLLASLIRTVIVDGLLGRGSSHYRWDMAVDAEDVLDMIDCPPAIGARSVAYLAEYRQMIRDGDQIAPYSDVADPMKDYLDVMTSDASEADEAAAWGMYRSTGSFTE